ncbi:MAG: hypothetical protein LBC77_05570 [Spirochaetaceae bacterium]|jgi:class 3 adenylate cyclase|nr:hypothetical protein [Spirochaetaceae bacterium]
MAAYITRKILLARLLLPLAASCAALALSSKYFFEAPVKLGSRYDKLAASRAEAPVAREILIIETGKGGREQIITPAAASELVLTLVEMRAASLVMLTPVLGAYTGARSGGEELIFRFDEEFKIINENIKNLFDGIRLGSIAPGEAPRFVRETMLLTSQGKERLLAAAARSEEAGALRMEKAISVFGSVYIPQDIGVSLVSEPQDAPIAGGIRANGYSRPAADGDGRVRRVYPAIENEQGSVSEHVVWRALKSEKDGEEGVEALLDTEGALLFESVFQNDFRRIPLSLFLEYEELDKTLYKLLAEEARLSVYGGIPANLYPSFLYEKAAAAKENFLDTDEETYLTSWLDGRKDYMRSLESFFDVKVKKNITNAFSKLIEEENLSEEGTRKIIGMRDAELQKYEIAEEVYLEFQTVYGKLRDALYDAFCIVGGAEDEDVMTSGAFGPVQTSALLANTVLTGKAITVVDKKDAALRSILPAALLILALFKRRFLMSVIISALYSLIVYATFGYGFVFSGRWLDPLVPTLTSAAAAGMSLICAAAAYVRMSREIKRAFAPVISNANLRRLIASKKPMPKDDARAFAAIVAVRGPNLNFIENKESTAVAVESLNIFRKEARDAFVKAGAVIIGAAGDTVIAAFGAPVERLAIEGSKKTRPYSDGGAGWGGSPAEKAACTALEMPPERAKSVPWCFGIDYGECSFSGAPLTGYTAIGRAVARARALSKLCLRYKVKYLVTASAAERIDPIKTKKITAEKPAARAPDYYELVVSRYN